MNVWSLPADWNCCLTWWSPAVIYGQQRERCGFVPINRINTTATVWREARRADAVWLRMTKRGPWQPIWTRKASTSEEHWGETLLLYNWNVAAGRCGVVGHASRFAAWLIRSGTRGATQPLLARITWLPLLLLENKSCSTPPPPPPHLLLLRDDYRESSHLRAPTGGNMTIFIFHFSSFWKFENLWWSNV